MKSRVNKVAAEVLCIFFLFSCSVAGQTPLRKIKGTVYDIESLRPLSGAAVIVTESNPLISTTSSGEGIFVLQVPAGRISLKISHVGYEDRIFRDILVTTGKDVVIEAGMKEKAYQAKEIIVTASGNKNQTLNQMAAVSVNTIRTDDALRYAGGFYDPSRIVNAFAGIVTANNDESNDIVIRGNSSRGLLWRLEGIEIPNPNHFSDGQGGSGGAYSAITSNVIANFDFFTGAFPAEYGNAVSGVMDLNLRKGNSDNFGFGFQTGMIGAEISAEGPLNAGKGSSFLIDARYVNFGFLSRLDIIDLGSNNYAPRSKDMVFNIYLPSGKRGNINIFGFAGSSAIGQKAETKPSQWITDDDRKEEMENLGSFTAGIKHVKTLRDGNSFLRTVIALTGYQDKYRDGYITDSLIIKNNSYHDYRYPAIRLSLLFNHKENRRTVMRTGINIGFLRADMEDYKLNPQGSYDTIVSPSGSGILSQYFFQIKNRLSENFEVNSGFHVIDFSVNENLSVEPRLGVRWQLAPGLFLTGGAGLHSRCESFQVYYNLIKNDYGIYETLNRDLGFSKSFQAVGGIDYQINKNLNLKFETYYQYLFNVPVVYSQGSRYSAINSAEGLPSSEMENKGKGYNRGVELTLTRHYSSNYYYLATLSLFDSKYMAADKKWYNTYYNTSFVSNFLAGKDFYFGSEKRNCISLNFRTMIRGGYRYTPVDIQRSLKQKRIIYLSSETYGARLPSFFRTDGGISYRRNNPDFSWVLMLDVQNITGKKNIYRKKFYYENGLITEKNVYSIGTVPVINFRVEF